MKMRKKSCTATLMFAALLFWGTHSLAQVPSGATPVTGTNAAAPSPTASPSPTPSPIVLGTPKQMPEIVEYFARSLAKNIKAAKVRGDAHPERAFQNASRELATMALAAAANPDKAKTINYEAQYTASLETSRTDKQIGSSARTTGSTSATDKPGIPYLLGLAIDHGAVTQNINGSTLTLSSSPYALIASIPGNGDTAETYNNYSDFTRVGVSASFDLQDQNDPLASVHRKQLSEWSVKFRILGDRSARSEAAHTLFQQLMLPALQNEANVLGSGVQLEFGGEDAANALQAFATGTAADIAAYVSSPNYSDGSAEDELTKRITDSVQHRIYANIASFALPPDQIDILSSFLTRFKTATDAVLSSSNTLDAAIKDLAQKATLTLGYFNERGSGTGSYSVAKLMFEKKPPHFTQIDFNASASAYHDPNPTLNQTTFRDATAALGFLQPFGKSPFLTDPNDKSRITVSFSGRYERLQENRHVPNKKADIAVANWKIEIPVGQGVSLPISITYANATELINEQDVRGNFGITFDLDKLRLLVAAK